MEDEEITELRAVVRKLRTKVAKVLAELEEMHHSPLFCKGYRIYECQESDCWVWRLIAMLKEK